MGIGFWPYAAILPIIAFPENPLGTWFPSAECGL